MRWVGLSQSSQTIRAEIVIQSPSISCRRSSIRMEHQTNDSRNGPNAIRDGLRSQRRLGGETGKDPIKVYPRIDRVWNECAHVSEANPLTAAGGAGFADRLKNGNAE